MADGLIDNLFLKVYHLTICFWALDDQINNGTHFWVGEGGRSFIHDGCITAVTVCCSKVSLQFLYVSGKFLRCYWPKVKIVSFQVSAPTREVSIDFGLWAWFISSFLTSVLIGIGGLSLVSVSWDL